MYKQLILFLDWRENHTNSNNRVKLYFDNANKAFDIYYIYY